MKYILFIAALAARVAHAQEPSHESCKFVLPWANQAYHISHLIGLEEEKWIISGDGSTLEEYATILAIKREAYHDVPALRRRVETACAAKEPT